MERIDVIGEIKKAGLGDLQDIHDCNKRNLSIYYTMPELISMIFSGNYQFITCKINNTLIGYTILYKKTDTEYHIYSIALDKNYRHHGYGSKMIDYIKIIQPDIKKVCLHVSINNVCAINCYKKNNFVTTKTKINYYDKETHNSRDAYVMERIY